MFSSQSADTLIAHFPTVSIATAETGTSAKKQLDSILIATRSSSVSSVTAVLQQPVHRLDPFQKQKSNSSRTCCFDGFIWLCW
jgi:hypothetical protein